MSEYRYYEFRALDRPLTRGEIAELRKLSSRARITPTSFVNVYNFSDFRGDPVALMKRFFDAFVRLEEWGSRWFMVRVPQRSLTAHEARRFAAGSCFEVFPAGRNVVLSFSAALEEETDDDVNDGWLDVLLPIRDALLAGDRRPLYLGWLSGVQAGEVNVGVTEPPVPPGMSELGEPLRALATFLMLDRDLLDAAAEQSSPVAVERLTRRQLRAWIEKLDARERDDLLVSLLESDDRHRLTELRRRIARAVLPEREGENQGSRRVWDLLVRAEQRRRAREPKRGRRGAGSESPFLAILQDSAPELWDEIELLVERGGPQSYERVVQMLRDLHTLAELEGTEAEFAEELEDFVTTYRSKSSLLSRLRAAGLVAGAVT